ncbi:NADH dehydrogenase subunit 5 [Anopheles sinensis]|uniref:NADH dehydrogenase subunit 5 n=1 Tax=Anopheles sinensis TaxID=74873 RepID=A0A084VVW1_ANOSI|nr:NADH dehydrogenase subunit 5 [Anopheles sinensis]
MGKDGQLLWVRGQNPPGDPGRGLEWADKMNGLIATIMSVPATIRTGTICVPQAPLANDAGRKKNKENKPSPPPVKRVFSGKKILN